MTTNPEPEDTCRLEEIGGEIIRVHGAGQMSDESREALAALISVAKRKYAAEHPETEPVDPERRERYAEALYATLEVSPTRHPWETLSPLRRAVWYARADAAVAVADGELAAAVSVPPPTRADDRADVLNAAAQHLYTALFPAVYDDMGQKAAEGVNRAVSELRRMADGAQQQQCPGVETVPNRCTCDCEGCKHHCGAHNPDEAQQQPDTETREADDPTQCSGEEGPCPEHGFHRHSLKQPGPGRVADEEPTTQTQAQEPETEEQVIRDHVTRLHLIGEQLADLEFWMWEHLANVRDAERQQPETQDETPVPVHAVPLPGSNGISSCCGRPPCEFVGEHVTRDPDKVTCRGPE